MNPADSSTVGSAYLVRCVIGGVLMGLANLVPGISGGTMLLAAGVYPAFINGIAEVTTLTFRVPTLIKLAAIVTAAGIAIIAGAGFIKDLVVDHRWVMYALFIGLTLGGAPVVWKLLRPANLAAALGCVFGTAVMALMAFLQPGASDGSDASYLLLFLSGLAGASAMILPGISGGYLLLILGQYIAILSAIERAKTAVLGEGGPDMAALIDAMHVFVPVGVGVGAGVVGVSNLVRFLLDRYAKATLGLLLGLLLGAVLGLWPFQHSAEPRAGEVVKGRVLTPEQIAKLERQDYPLETFSPTGGQIAASIGLIGLGFGTTQLIARVGRSS